MSRWAPGLRPRSDARRLLVVAGLAALALLGLGEAAPAAFPVEVSIEGHASGELVVTVDGQQHAVEPGVGPGWLGVALEEPGPLQREYQIDGSDTTSTGDRQPDVVSGLVSSPLYRVDAWLRDEGSYSRWERLRITDLATGQVVAGDGGPGRDRLATVGPGRDGLATVGLGDGGLPGDFLIQAALRRPEAPARLWLVADGDRREGLELDRDRRNARWVIERNGATEALPRWFFPEQPAPFAAELLNLVGRSAMAAYAMALATMVLAGGLRALRARLPPSVGDGDQKGRRRGFGGTQLPLDVARHAARKGIGAGGERLLPGRGVGGLVLAVWVVGAGVVGVRVFHQLPHILDAIAYTSQASLFASGRIAIAAPALVNAFKGPFEVLWRGRLFAQYPPGAPAVYALGKLVSLEWLVGPLACLTLIVATAWTARVLYGQLCGGLVLCLGVLSPFILFQSGSFLSHPIAGGLLAAALAAFVAGESHGRQRWYALCGVLLGAGFLTREASSVLFALPLGLRVLATRRWQALSWLVAYGLPLVLVYLIYNTLLTGSPLLLPRAIFDPSDHFGFGDGVGFHTRHTLAAGLANTDELLTLLQLDLFGWPPLFSLGLLGVPFLVGRFRSWDVLAACGVLAFVVAYAAYFYHGIALGPRYYFEAVPWLLLLAARGAQVLSRLARSRLAVMLVLAALSVNTLVFYLPAEIERRTNFSALPGARELTLGFVQNTILGPQLTGVPSGSLVVTDDWWLYNAALAALNCAQLPDCDVLFALATNPNDLSLLRAEFPERAVLRTVDDGQRVDLVQVP